MQWNLSQGLSWLQAVGSENLPHHRSEQISVPRFRYSLLVPFVAMPGAMGLYSNYSDALDSVRSVRVY